MTGSELIAAARLRHVADVIERLQLTDGEVIRVSVSNWGRPRVHLTDGATRRLFAGRSFNVEASGKHGQYSLVDCGIQFVACFPKTGLTPSEVTLPEESEVVNG